MASMFQIQTKDEKFNELLKCLEPLRENKVPVDNFTQSELLTSCYIPSDKMLKHVRVLTTIPYKDVRIYSCTFRAKLRSRFGLPDAPAPDWITHCLCEYCALCQEYRELKNRGLDPTIGWIGNVQRQQIAQQPAMMTLPMGQRMMG